jgi:hypothetical protein
MFSKKRVRKIIVISTAVKLIFTVAGLVFVQVIGIHLPNPIAMMENHIATAFGSDSDEPRTLMPGIAGVGKAGRSPDHHHVM